MNRQREPAWSEARLVARRPDGALLVVQRRADQPWQFPATRLTPPLAIEQALREACRADLGLVFDELSPLAQFSYGHGTAAVAYYYFTARIGRDEALPLGVEALRWVQRAELALLPVENVDRAILERAETDVR